MHKFFYNIAICKSVMLAIQYCCRNFPFCNGVISSIEEIFPRKSLSKGSGDTTFTLKLCFRYVGPKHHIGNKLVHIENQGNKRLFSSGSFSKPNMLNHAPMLLANREMCVHWPSIYSITDNSSGTTCHGSNESAPLLRSPCSGRSILKTCHA